MGNSSRDIYFADLLVMLFRCKYFVIAFVLCSFVCCYFYNQKAPREYQSEVSFILQASGGNDGLAAKYSSLLGVGGGGGADIPGHLKGFLKTRQLETFIRVGLVKKGYSSDSTSGPFWSTLGLDKHLTIDLRPPVYYIRYSHSDPKVSVEVVNLTISGLQKMVFDYQLSSNRNFIEVVDSPILPKVPFKPNIRMNYIVTGASAFILAWILSIIWCLWRRRDDHAPSAT